jgi:hypothetical protein
MCIKLVIKKIIDIMMHGQRNIQIQERTFVQVLS